MLSRLPQVAPVVKACKPVRRAAREAAVQIEAMGIILAATPDTEGPQR